jgi:diguanylate cyclase (GGDEF)-like protein
MPIDKQGGSQLRQILVLTLSAGTISLGIGALLAFAVGRRPGRSILRPWPLAWSALALAMGMLLAAGSTSGSRRLFFYAALASYAAFGLCFLAGLAGSLRIEIKPSWWAGLAMGALLAVAASIVVGGETGLYFAPSLIVTATALTGLAMFGRTRRLRGAGDIAVLSALTLLALSGLRYVLTMAILSTRGEEPVLAFWVYNGVFDIMLLVALAVGTMLVVTDHMQAKLQERNLELAAAKDTLEVIAKIDPLTGVSNRYAFYLCVQELGDLDAYDGCLLMIDIDNLKVINDTQGHVAGDRAICAVAERLRALVRAEDRIFRWGGDEFVVLLLDANPESALERISRFGTVKVASSGAEVSQVDVSISWGVAPFGSGKSIEDVLKSADLQLYSSRRALE